MAAQPNAVGGVGQVTFTPNSRNVLPGKVVFTVDIRTVDQQKLDRMRAEIETRAAEICTELGVGCAIEAVGHFDPVTFDPVLVGRVRDAAEKLGYSHMDIVSGAGHDACWAAKVAPTTMIFCPCVDGLSHNEAEEISPEWAAAGADLLVTTGGLSVDPDDVTRQALLEAGLTDMLHGVPVLPGTMSMVGRIPADDAGPDMQVMGVPACALYYKTTFLDLMLPRLLAGRSLTRAEAARLGEGGYCTWPKCWFGK